MADVTPRMKNWLTGLGAHIAVASKSGIPAVVVVDSATADNGNTIRFILSEKQVALIRSQVTENPRVAFGPGGIGSIRAAYQFKGAGRLENNILVVAVDEIYSTKPGPEAGLRLDVLPYDQVIQFETSRWLDNGPPK
jgi:hypothetical protein